jgi:hypothetical protein
MLKVIAVKWLLVGLCCLLPLATSAADPRLSTELVQALQAQVALQQKALRLQEDDAEAQKATLWQWLVEAKKADTTLPPEKAAAAPPATPPAAAPIAPTRRGRPQQ